MRKAIPNFTFPADVKPPLTVWGVAVHGKTGTWSADSGTPQIWDHIYRIPQHNADQPRERQSILDGKFPIPIPGFLQDQLPIGVYSGRDDTYICDSRRWPNHCGLIGGNLWNCLDNFEEATCGSFCEDKGDRLVLKNSLKS